ncbi:DUF5131 family protein [Thermotoga sp. KOL6]|uniref:SPL family radical SAM protein n=1 Tax=Thermotoga sp. KOL6 TaxID=126741 RepID=UPI000C7564C5|nr:DUF5131 family protein [Thermotoga sp. KOL6]PLV58712.1 radical SAM protein [Thermotoga sp. KOL6]
MKIKEIETKTALNYSEAKSRYTLNPYVGCSNACIYCYARDYARRYRKIDWKEEILVKINIVETLRRDIIKRRPRYVFMSTMCDPYQQLEEVYKLSRKCLEVFLEFPLLEVEIMILTKSSLVLRDLDLFKKLKKISVGLTITTDNDEIRKLFEPRASSIEERLETLRFLKENGLKTSVFISPMLPMNPEKLAKMVKPYADSVFIDDMHYKWRVENLYKRYGLSRALTNDFFRSTKKKILEILKK